MHLNTVLLAIIDSISESVLRKPPSSDKNIILQPTRLRTVRPSVRPELLPRAAKRQCIDRAGYRFVARGYGYITTLPQ